jgi:hypothetical protein
MSPHFPIVTLGVKLVLTVGHPEFKQCLDALFP